MQVVTFHNFLGLDWQLCSTVAADHAFLGILGGFWRYAKFKLNFKPMGCGVVHNHWLVKTPSKQWERNQWDCVDYGLTAVGICFNKVIIVDILKSVPAKLVYHTTSHHVQHTSNFYPLVDSSVNFSMSLFKCIAYQNSDLWPYVPGFNNCSASELTWNAHTWNLTRTLNYWALTVITIGIM